MKMKKGAIWLLILCLAGCLAAPSLASASEEGEPFVVGATTKLSGAFFTGMWGNNTSDMDVRELLHGYSPVAWTMQTIFELNPTVVKDISVGEMENGNRLYMVDIAENLTYNDGTRITAADYVFSILLQGSPHIGALGGNATDTLHIAGYDAYVSGQTDVFAGVRLLDTYRYAIEVDKAYLPFFYELGMIDFSPCPISVIAPGCEVADDGEGAYIRNENGGGNTLFTVSLLRETLLDPAEGYLSHPWVTSGPYELVSYDQDMGEAIFRSNDRFIGNYTGQKPTIEWLKFVNVTPEGMIDALETGEVHLLNKCVAAETIDAGLVLTVEGAFTPQGYPRMGLGFVSFSCETGPAQHEAVRKAIAHSIDNQAFTNEYISENYGISVYGYYGLGQWMVQMIEGALAPPEDTEDEALDDWEALSLDGLDHYEKDAQVARKLLIEDGWTLNESGGDFVEGRDATRYKRIDGKLVGLTMRFGKTRDSLAAEIFEEMMVAPLAEIGITLEVVELPFTQVLAQYYQQETRTCDMLYLATNFLSAFDPYPIFSTEAGFMGAQNATGYRDAELEALALAMRRTEPGDLLAYCRKWLAFQERFTEKLPMLPLYSNIYFDFHVSALQGYFPSAHPSGATAILYAWVDEG